MAIVGINPARYGSKRPPGTPLSKISGQTPIDGERLRVPFTPPRGVEGPGPRTTLLRVAGRRGVVVHTSEALERRCARRAAEKGRVA